MAQGMALAQDYHTIRPLPHLQGPSHTFKAPPTPSKLLPHLQSPSHTFKAPPIPSKHPLDPSVPHLGRSGWNRCSLRLGCHI